MEPLEEVRLPELWDNAVASLSEDDREQLGLGSWAGQSQHSELLRAVEEQKLDCENKQWRLYGHRSMKDMDMLDTLGRLNDSLAKFKELAGQVQRPSEHASLLWASLKTLLRVSFVDSQLFGTTLDNVESILGIFTRYTVLEVDIFGKDSDAVEELSAGIVKLYGSVLRYLVQALRYHGQKQLGKETSDSPDVDFCEPLLRFEKHEEKARQLLRRVQDEDYTVNVDGVSRVIHSSVEAYNSWSRRRASELAYRDMEYEPLQNKGDYDAVPLFADSGELHLSLLAITAISMSNRQMFDISRSNPGLFRVRLPVRAEEGTVKDPSPTELYRYCRLQCMDVVRYILDEGHQIDEATGYSWEAATLTYLCEMRDIATAMAQRSARLLGLVDLLDRLARKDHLDDLMLPIRKWTNSVVDAMLDHGASGNILFPDRSSALDRVMESPAKVRKFLENGTDPNEESGKWWLPLVNASATGNVEVVEALIEGGARLDGNPMTDHHLCNPLHAAVDAEHFDVAKLLLDRGADINHSNGSGVTCLLVAAEMARPQSVEWLLGMGASMQGIWKTLDQSVFDAVDMTDGSAPGIRRLLVRRGCFRVSLPGGNQAPRPASEALGDDCLAMKAFGGDLRGVRGILEGPARHAADRLGEALMAASALGHLDVVEALLSYGVEADLTDVNGRTALHHAIMEEHPAVADLLTEHGVSVLVEDVSGSTPFDLAVAHGQKAMGFIQKHLGSFFSHVADVGPSPTETGPSEAPIRTAAQVRNSIPGLWNGFYRYTEWRTMEEETWSIYIKKLPPQGSQPSAFFYEGGDEGEFCLHGFVDPAGTLWFVKLYEAEGWLFRGELDSGDKKMKGTWGRNRKLWFGSFNMIKMPFFKRD